MNNIKEQIINTFYYKRTNKKTGKDIFNLRSYFLSIYNKEENKEFNSYIINTFKDDYVNIEYNLKEILYRIKHDIKEIPKCPICGKRVRFAGPVYRITCSEKCQRKLVKEKSKQTILERYGVDNAAKSDIVKDKIRKTCLEKYGVENATQTKEVQNKMKKTCLEKYGSENFAKTKYFKDIMKENKDIINNKIIQTKMLHNTFNTSKTEDETYFKLIELFGVSNVIRQYISNVYPFSCDFYIKSLDLYIECNYHWTHGKHQYSKNNITDIITKCKWKQQAKTSKFYKNAISTWTKRDVNKFEYAKKNNLNYLVFYSTKEFNDWYYCFGMSVT